MNYLKILQARRKSGPTPSLEPRNWSPEQRLRAARGLCVQCGARPADASSYRCGACQDEDTLEEVRREIGAQRDAVLRTTR